MSEARQDGEWFDETVEDYLAWTRRPHLKARLNTIDNVLIRHAHQVNHGRTTVAIELGAGAARLLGRLDATRRIAFDGSIELLKRAPSGVIPVLADIRELPLPDAYVDAALSGFGGFRTRTPERQLAETARVLKDHGAFAFHGFTRNRFSLRGLLTRGRPFLARHDVSQADFANQSAMRREYAERGLWISRLVAWRNQRRGPSYGRRIPRQLAWLVSHLAVLGQRVPRAHVQQWRELRTQLDAGKSPKVLIRGESMAPTLRFGDFVHLSPIASPKRGDIVCLLARDQFVVHRVVARLGAKTWLKGDAPAAKVHRADTWRIIARATLQS